MGATETATFLLRAETRELDAAVQASRGKVISLNGGVTQLASTLDRVGGKAGRDAQQAIGAFAGALGPAAGKTAQLVNNIGDLAGALSGGGLTLALAGAGVAVAALTSHWDDLIQKQDEAIAKIGAGLDPLISQRKALEKQVDDLRRAAGLEGPKDRFAATQREIDDAQKRIDDIRHMNLFAQKEREGEIKQLEAIVRLLERRQNLEQLPFAKGAQKAVGGPTADALEMQAARDKYAIEDRISEQAEKELEAFDRLEKEKTKIAEEQARERAKTNAMLQDMRMRAVEQSVEREQALWDDFYSVFSDSAQAAFSNVIGASASFFAMQAAGEKRAAQKSAATFLSSTGQQLVGVGTKAVWEGIVANAAIPGSGVPLMLAGGGAIAAGVAMGATGSGISASVSKAEARDADRARARKRGGTERGVNQGRSTPSSGLGGKTIVVNVSYGAVGPKPEDSAREIIEALLDGERRGL